MHLEFFGLSFCFSTKVLIGDEKKQGKSIYFTCLIIFLPGPKSTPPSGYIEFWYFKSLVYRYIAPYIVHILCSLSSFVQETVITMHLTNLNKQGNLALLYIYI